MKEKGDEVQRWRGRRGHEGQDAAEAGHFAKKQGGTSVFSVLSTLMSDGNVHCSDFAEWLVPMIHPDLN